MPAFIETQFPIARLSAESYKERKANNGQTLTRLGKWWGRKPLILVRAAILGMLMPASADAKKDREVFLQILTMDDDGAWQRCKPDEARKLGRSQLRASPMADMAERVRAAERARQDAGPLLARINAHFGTRAESLVALHLALGEQVFQAMPYADRIALCERPENVAGPDAQAWEAINAHLGTQVTNLHELVEQLGQRTFGHRPRVGDSFCGGGSIPFEAARIGCDAFGSDLNPVACLLTWAGLNLLGGGPQVQQEVMRVQAAMLKAADEQVTAWGIEHNGRGKRADAYLYCVEVKPEGCDYYIPLAPSWLVSENTKAVCRWSRVPGSDRLRPEIALVDDGDVKSYKEKKGATVVNGRVVDPFTPGRSWSLEALRGSDGLRPWTNDDLVPRSSDVFQERLYCIRWADADGNRRYAAPDDEDLGREDRVLELLRERFAVWQQKGFVPSRLVPVGGAETERLYRERGWSHWHHLFTPRQLLTHGLLAELGNQVAKTKPELVACLLGLAKLANMDAKLCVWHTSPANDNGEQVFLNLALNTLANYSNRPLLMLPTGWPMFTEALPVRTRASQVSNADARDLRQTCDLWITDPPYADAVNYHELGDFFLAWFDKQLTHVFPEWTPDARAVHAVRGDGDDFRRSMVEIYKNLTRHMPENGLQMVMFTHQDPAVWADLGMILWAAGLKATAAWTLSTETAAVGLKKGNYVQGTVCLVLRKRIGDEPGFLDEVYPLVEDEVKQQIANMQALDDDGEPNFNDADYQLAAYAAALKVLTQYGNLDGRDVEHEVFAVRGRNEKSDFQAVIERALVIACDTLIPRGLDANWRDLTLAERYYLRALDIESRGERRQGMYEELARGFGVTDIRPLLKSDKANGARMHTASGFGAAGLAPLAGTGDAGAGAALPARRGRAASGAPHPFAAAPLRHLLFAVRETMAADENPESGRQYLRDTFGQGYWAQRERFVGLLEWLAQLGNAVGMEEWAADSQAARILAGRLRNDHA
jgi:adenine-specific DNA methylase